jgi:hypothetical protein
MIIVQVGSTDSSGTEPHQYLAILWAWLWAILNFELFGSVNDTSNHTGKGFSVLEGVSVSERMWVTRACYSALGVSLGVFSFDDTGFRYFASPFGQRCNPLAELRGLQSSVSDLPPRWL